ncbi:MAG: DMT family transporter [Candidatus Kapabacteria bacterium]|nr:DMT family transporter [Candidatus Kapabacteria bacterium]
MQRHHAEIALALITVLWAGTFVVIKTALAESDPSVFVALRFGLALVIGLVIWRRSLSSIDGTTLRRGSMLGLIFGSGFLLQTFGLTETSASTSAFITGTMVAFVPLVQRILHGTSLRGTHAASIVLILGGLYLFTSPELMGIRLGDVQTLVSAMIWAIYVVKIDDWTSDVREDPQRQNALVVLQFAATVVLALLSMVLFNFTGHGTTHLVWSSNVITAVLYCSIFASVIPTFVQTRFQQFTHPVRAGIIFAMEPLAASVIAVAIGAETLSMRQMMGGGVLIAAIVVPDIIAMRRGE